MLKQKICAHFFAVVTISLFFTESLLSRQRGWSFVLFASSMQKNNHDSIIKISKKSNILPELLDF
jgi:hypothetical protein